MRAAKSRAYADGIRKPDRDVSRRTKPSAGLLGNFARVRGPAARQGVVRYPRRVSFGKSLYLLVTPKGGRLWQYRYRFQGREKLLSFGGYPDVSMGNARARGRAARQLLEFGIDTSERRKELRHMPGERV